MEINLLFRNRFSDEHFGFVPSEVGFELGIFMVFEVWSDVLP